MQIFLTLGKSNDEDGVDDKKAQQISANHVVNHNHKRTHNAETSTNKGTKHQTLSYVEIERQPLCCVFYSVAKSTCYYLPSMYLIMFNIIDDTYFFSMTQSIQNINDQMF